MRKTLLSIAIVMLFSFTQKSPSVQLSDFKQSVGEWKGKLAYLDYSSGVPFTMSANANVIIDSSKGSKIILQFTYPKEPNANGNDTLSISKNGSFINGKEVSGYKKSDEGVWLMTTEQHAVDGNDNKSCSIQHIYIFNKNFLVLRKEVRFEGEQNWIVRSEYTFQR